MSLFSRERVIPAFAGQPENAQKADVSTSKLARLRSAGHFPTLLSAFLYFDYSFMVWTLLGALGAHIAAPESLNLSAQQKGLMVAVPILAGAAFRIILGFIVDRIGAKSTGVIAQCTVIAALTGAWLLGLKNFEATLVMGLALGVAGGSFAIAIPQAGQWYPPNMQGLVLGLAGAGNIGVVIDSILAPRLAEAYGWQNVFGFALAPAILVLIAYMLLSKEPPRTSPNRRVADYFRLLKEKDTHWFCFYYTVSFGGFVGLASSFVIYFRDQFDLSVVRAGDLAALCTAVGALARPFGGALADWIGGIRALHIFYSIAGAALVLSTVFLSLSLNVACFLIASCAFGMANGSVFQLLPQRFSREFGLMTGLVGCGGGIGGFLLASMLGFSRELTGTYLTGLLVFAGLCFLALLGLGTVKGRWRSTWGAITAAKV